MCCSSGRSSFSPCCCPFSAARCLLPCRPLPADCAAWSTLLQLPSYSTLRTPRVTARAQTFGGEVESVRRLPPLSPKALHNAISTHLYRRGAFRAAARFAEVCPTWGLASVHSEGFKFSSNLWRHGSISFNYGWEGRRGFAFHIYF